MVWRNFNGLLMMILFVLTLAVTLYIAYQKTIDKENRHSIHESEWIDEIASSKCGTYTKYGSINVDLVSRELMCRQMLMNQIRMNCSMERDQWYSIFSTSGDGAKYRECVINLEVNL